MSNPTTRRRVPSFDRGGDRNYDALPPEGKARVDFINWTIEEGARREVGARRAYAAHAARHLAATAPDRFAKAVASRATRPDDVYAALVALAEAAAEARA